jgi:hypothetical protein
MKYTGLRNKGYIGAAAIIGTAAIADLWMDVRENNHARHTELEQERSIKKQRKKDIEDRWVGLEDPMQYNGAVQQMFNSRIGHSNSWGGRRY